MQPENDPLQPLREAFLRPSDDATDVRERTRDLADRLSTSLSQLPSHVQFQGRPATEWECAAMLEALPLFEQLAEDAGLRTRYGELVARCRLHYSNYRRFLSTPDRPASYAEFQTGR